LEPVQSLDPRKSGKELQVIEMKKVRSEIGPASEFLQAHIKGSLRVKGTQILIDGVEHHELKLILHKFLHHRGLNGYKVRSRPEILEIVPPDEKENQKRSKGTSPTSPETMPYFFPGRQ
jgi:hypothetical protein